MALDLMFSNSVLDIVKTMLDFYRMTKSPPKLATVLKSKNVGDFSCGYFSGMVMGLGITKFQERYKRKPTEKEQQEIMEIIGTQLEAINRVFQKFDAK